MPPWHVAGQLYFLLILPMLNFAGITSKFHTDSKLIIVDIKKFHIMLDIVRPNAAVLAFLLHIWEVPDLNLGLEIGYPG
jgi:hypothetical protein